MVKAEKTYAAAEALRDQCYEAMRDPELEDPGDAQVYVKTRDVFALEVLHILDSIGVPRCRAR